MVQRRLLHDAAAMNRFLQSDGWAVGGGIGRLQV